MSESFQKEIEFAGRKLRFETGRLAFQANGSVLATYGETVVLANATATDFDEEADGLPLRLDFEEKLYAGGLIRSSRFVKRETAPSEAAILAGRTIDRGLRPFFPKDFQNETQVVVTVLSVDLQNDPGVLGAVAASAALAISDIPWRGPLATIKVGYVDGRFVVNPTKDQMEASPLELIYTGSKERAVMIDAGADELPEAKFIEALEFAQKEIQPLLQFIESFAKERGRKKIDYKSGQVDDAVYQKVEEFAWEKIKSLAHESLEAESFEAKREALAAEVHKKFEGKFTKAAMSLALHLLRRKAVRHLIITEGKRVDGRALDELRPIGIEVGLLPRTHGSALFTRGLSQALSVVTLGSASLEQLIEGPQGEESKRYIHHYSAAPFSTGETGAIRSAGRRDVGHGALAEKALRPMIPNDEDFPYTIRVVSEILSQNGSTSMAAVCGSTLSLMDAGVPIKAPVAGISMGLVYEDNQYKILTDIAGVEDFNGDMDFKSAGSSEGLTAVQLDVKLEGGVPVSILAEALLKARAVRGRILEMIEKVLPSPRQELSKFAPRIILTKIDPKKIGEVVGSGGRNIRNIMAATQTAIDIEDDGSVYISGSSVEQNQRAKEIVESLVREVKVGELYEGRVSRLLEFGAFVEILPGQEGLVHISELAPSRVNRVTDVVRVGERIKVKVIGIDDQGRINLSKKALEVGGTSIASVYRAPDYNRPGLRRR